MHESRWWEIIGKQQSDIYNNLVDIQSTINTSLTLVDPLDAENSILWLRVSSDDANYRMPQGGQLSSENINDGFGCLLEQNVVSSDNTYMKSGDRIKMYIEEFSNMLVIDQKVL